MLENISSNLNIPLIDKCLITKRLSNIFSKFLWLLSEQRVRVHDHPSPRKWWYYFLSVIIQLGYQRQQPVWRAGMSLNGPRSVRMNAVFYLEESLPAHGRVWNQMIQPTLFYDCMILDFCANSCELLKYIRNCLFLNNLFFWWQAITLEHSKWVLTDRSKT